MREQLNNYLSSITSSNITHNKDIDVTDLDGNSKTVCRCYATIVAGKSISMYMDVLDSRIYTDFREEIQAKIDEHIAEAKALAIQYNVPIVY